MSKLWRELLSDDMAWKFMCEKHAYRRLSDDASLAAEPLTTATAAAARTTTRTTTTTATATATESTASVVSLRPAPVPHLARPGSSPQIFGGHGGSTASAASTSTRSFDGATFPRRRPNAISYRSHFKHRYMVETAWRHGGRAVSHHITPDQGVVTCLHLTPKYIVVGLDNAKIHVFDPDGDNQKTLTGHVMGVWAMVPWGDVLVSGGCDRDVRVWDLVTGCVRRFLLPSRPWAGAVASERAGSLTWIGAHAGRANSSSRVTRPRFAA